MSLTGKRIQVTGRVQGVGYRYFCLEQATTLSIFGCARNRSDGSVEVLAVGESETLTAFLQALGRGPIHAGVDSVEERDLEHSLIERIVTRGEFEIG